MKVKYIWTSHRLTTCKVYDVIKYNKNNNTVDIIDNLGEYKTYYMGNPSTTYFIDVTIEYRSKVIDGILN